MVACAASASPSGGTSKPQPTGGSSPQPPLEEPACQATFSTHFRVCFVSLTDTEERELGDVHCDYVSENIRGAFL